MRPYINKIESNIKNGTVSQPGRKTLILGPSGSGKSAQVNALEAAGSGKVSDVAGRALLAKDADLSMLTHGSKVWAVAKMDDGMVANFELEKGHRSKRSGPEIAFPLRDVRDAILGSPETARKWVLGRTDDVIDWDALLTLIPPSLHTRLATIVGGGDLVVGAADAITGSLETARKRVREANAEAKAARSVSAPPGPPPTDEEIKNLEGIIRGWDARGAAPAIDATRNALASARENADRLAKVIASAEAEIATLKITPTTPLRRAAVEVIEAMAQAKAPQCWICGGTCNSNTIASRAQLGRARITEEAATARRKLDLEFALREANADIGAARREVERLTAEEARISRLATDAGAIGASLPMAKEEAETQLRSMHSRRVGWEAARRAEERALASEREVIEWDQLAEALSKALGVLVEKARIGFEARVQKFLPESDIFGIDLLDGDREILRVGLRRSGVHDRGAQHPEPPRLAGLDAALSGAEWSRVTAALALATAPATGPCVVVPEERAFDAHTLAIVLEAFDKAIQGDDAPQLIVTSPVEPARIPAGWTVIRTGTIEVARYTELAEGEPFTLPGSRVLGDAVIKGMGVTIENPALAEDMPKHRGRPKGSKNKTKGEVNPQNAPPEVSSIFEMVKGEDGRQIGLKEVPTKTSPFDPFGE